MWFLRFSLVFLSLGRIGSSAENGLPGWPQFRGPKADGHSAVRDLPTTWGGFLERYAWQASIPGRGWSSPIVIGDRIWLTTAESTAMRESDVAHKLAASEADIEDFQTHGKVTFLAIELDLNTGTLLRKVELFSVDNPPPIHATNSYASPTPATDGEHLFCHFGSLGTVGMSLVSGRVQWKRRLTVEDITGSGSSPILIGNRLIIACDGADEQYLVALDKKTGAILWQTARPPMIAKESFRRRAFSTPILIHHSGRQQLIASTAQWLVSYDPENGAEWWRCKTAMGYSVIPQPAFHDGLAFVCTGYTRPELWAIRVDGSGDVSETHVVWKYSRQAPEIASPIVIEDALYLVSVSGVLSCLRASDGQIQWQRRLEGNYAASPIFADQKLYLTSQSGLTTVLKPGPTYTELAKNQTLGETMATLAIAGDSLLLRSNPILYCIRLPHSPENDR